MGKRGHGMNGIKLSAGLRTLLGATIVGVTLASWGCGGGDSSEAVGENSVKIVSGRGTTEAAPVPNGPPTVRLKTSLGSITIELFPDKAPLTVANFLEYVESGYYKGTIFHDVQRGFVAIGGGFEGDLSEKSHRPPIRNEASGDLRNTKGTVAMSRIPDVIDSATCQFFFNLTENDALDQTDRTTPGYGYCVFAKVVQGWEVVEQIAASEVHAEEDFANLPVQTVLIESATRLQ